jgi:hypothetical protein
MMGRSAKNEEERKRMIGEDDGRWVRMMNDGRMDDDGRGQKMEVLVLCLKSAVPERNGR